MIETLLLSSTFFAVFGANNIDFDIIFGHQPDSLINPAEKIELEKIFSTADLNQDLSLSFDEFALFLQDNINPYSEQFTMLDINNNNRLEYAETVYSWRQLIELSPDMIFGNHYKNEWHDFESVYMDAAPTQEFTPETEAEFMASLLFYDIGKGTQDYMTKTEFIKYHTKNVWDQITKTQALQISFNEFESGFFDADLFKLASEHYSDTADFEELVPYVNYLEAAHTNPDIIIDEVIHGLVFEMDEFDTFFDEFDTAERRRLVPIIIPILGLGAAFGIWGGAMFGLHCAQEYTQQGTNCVKTIKKSCYYEYDTVHELNYGLMNIGDLSVGDYVYDGVNYTKVYYIQKYNKNQVTNMLEIKYGNPQNDNSIILTNSHLLYKAGHNEPVLSKDIFIGDELFGIKIDMNDLFDDGNYTVYEVRILHNLHPINPITESGHLMVNNIRTSVFSYSINEHNRLLQCGKIFAWISNNINEELAANMVNFYYNIIYKKLLEKNDYIKYVLVDNQFFFISITMLIPIYSVIILNKLLTKTIKTV